MIKSKKSRGFSLYIAVIIAGILLLVSFFVANIAVKQSYFANISKESELAIFAADAGIECALYWDSKYTTNPTSGSAFDPTPPSPAPSISCGGVQINDNAVIAATTTRVKLGGGGGSFVMSAFGFSLNSAANPTNACVIVLVNKSAATTHIHSYGYNTCSPSDPRRVERGIEVRY